MSVVEGMIEQMRKVIWEADNARFMAETREAAMRRDRDAALDALRDVLRAGLAEGTPEREKAEEILAEIERKRA